MRTGSFLLAMVVLVACTSCKEDTPPPREKGPPRYTLKGKVIRIWDTPYGDYYYDMARDKPPSGGNLTRAQLAEGKILIYYDQDGVEWIEVDGKPIPQVESIDEHAPDAPEETP